MTGGDYSSYPCSKTPSCRVAWALSTGSLVAIIAGRRVVGDRLSCPFCGDTLARLENYAVELIEKYGDKRFYDLLEGGGTAFPLRATPVKCGHCGKYAETLLVYVPEAAT